MLEYKYIKRSLLPTENELLLLKQTKLLITFTYHVNISIYILVATEGKQISANN